MGGDGFNPSPAMPACSRPCRPAAKPSRTAKKPMGKHCPRGTSPIPWSPLVGPSHAGLESALHAASKYVCIYTYMHMCIYIYPMFFAFLWGREIVCLTKHTISLPPPWVAGEPMEGDRHAQGLLSSRIMTLERAGAPPWVAGEPPRVWNKSHCQT